MGTGKFSLIVALSATVMNAPQAQAQNPAAQPAAADTRPAPPPEIEVGKMAPDFSIQVANSAGIAAEPVRLSDLRGKVVVLAFYPADRSSGCTHQLTKFRDEYKTMFGAETVVLPISVDSASTHASWG
jgi:peroxiredoxin